MRFLYIIGALVFSLAFVADARADEVSKVLGCKKDPCVVNHNVGGWIHEFVEAARLVNQGARTIVKINGTCLSACAIFADLARYRVCITPNARFGFHQAFYEDRDTGVVDENSYFDQPQSQDIDQWVRSHGGYPRNGYRFMKYNEALKFWNKCP